jgi:hypothetical protein
MIELFIERDDLEKSGIFGFILYCNLILSPIISIRGGFKQFSYFFWIYCNSSNSSNSLEAEENSEKDLEGFLYSKIGKS